MRNRLGTRKFYLVFYQSAIKTPVQPEGLATSHGGLSGTVLRNISSRSRGL